MFANDVDPGRQSATSQTPKTNAGTEKMACKLFISKREGELEKVWRELLLRGPINNTAEKPTNQAQITTSIVISCTKYLPLILNHMLTKTKAVQKVCITRLISAKLKPTAEKGKKNIVPIVTIITMRTVRAAIFPCEDGFKVYPFSFFFVQPP